MTTVTEMEAQMHIANLDRLFNIMIIAVLIAFFLSPDSLVTWSQTLPVNSVTDSIVEAAHRWRDLMDQLGVTSIFDKLREAFYFFKGLGWG